MLFDLDETLVDQVTAARAAAVGWAAAQGIEDAGVYDRWAAVSERHYARWQRREITFQGQRRERVREFLGRELSDADADALFAGYLERYEAGWTAYDDALPTLHRFRDAGRIVAVLTNGDEDQQRDKLERTGLASAVDVLIASSALPAGKPDPRAFHHALALLGVAPEQALMIGDSLAKDVHGALAAGLPAILLDRYGAHPDAGVPTIRTLNEAPTALR
nr:haloacid dehalogenase [Actinoplanes derwentensis]